MTRHQAGLALGCLALRPAVSSFRERRRPCGPASIPPRARDCRTRGPRGSILFLLALLATAGLPPRPALAGPQAPTAATCRERYHVFFSPPLRLPQPSSGTWGTAADEPGAVCGVRAAHAVVASVEVPEVAAGLAGGSETGAAKINEVFLLLFVHKK